MENVDIKNSNPCDDCGGRCCRCFGLYYCPEELEAKAEVEIEVKGISNSDIQFAAKNLIYLGEFKGNPLVPEHTGNHSRYYYTCRKLGLNGNCLDYQNRPRMCIGYGIDYPAGHIGCKMPLVRLAKIEKEDENDSGVGPEKDNEGSNLGREEAGEVG